MSDLESAQIVGKPDVEEHNILQSLPDEIILRVFSHFTPRELSSTLAKVCTRWWILSQDPSLWMKLNLVLTTEKQIEDFREIIERCSLLRCLTVEAKRSTVQLFGKLPNLKELNLQCCDFNTSDIEIIIDACPNIEAISFKYCDEIDTSSISCIVALPKLQSVHLKTCKKVDNSCLKIITDNCKDLTSFIVCPHWQSDVTNSGILDVIHRNTSSLRELCFYMKSLSYESIVAIGNCSNLSTLRLRHQLFLNDMSLQALSSLTRLKVLEFSCEGFRKPGLRPFFTRPCMAVLEDLTLTDIAIDDEILEEFAIVSQNMRKLTIDSCRAISNVGIQAVVSNCNKLRSLNLKLMPQLKGESLREVPTSLPNLKLLRISCCWRTETCSFIRSLSRDMPRLVIIHNTRNPKILAWETQDARSKLK